MLTVRVLTYAFVGIVGGEIAGRFKYFFFRMEDTALIDHVTGVYNSRYAGTAIGTGVGLYRRYQVPYSVIVLTCRLHETITTKPKRFRASVRHVANHVRNDIRVVDDLAHLGEGVFAVLLPHTPIEGARVCANRVTDSVRELLGTDAAELTSEVFSAATDGDALCDLGNRLAPDAGSSVCEPSAGVAMPSPVRTDRRESSGVS
jgi:GGDEF domain-containing protein